MSIAPQVRTALLEDLAGILQVDRACAEATHWTVEQYTKLLRAMINGAQRRAIFVAESEKALAGYAVVATAGAEAELESIAVSPGFRRQGIGRMLCRAVLRWAQDAGAEEVWLEVRSASQGAQALYAKLGFERAGVRKRYYAQPEDDAVLMSTKLPTRGHL